MLRNNQTLSQNFIIDKLQQDKTAIILGNGPSLRGFDFKKKLNGFITFGCNAAYRYWDQINWYPDYYACLDLVVGISHKEQIARLIKNSKEYGIKKFLLRGNLIKELGSIGEQNNVINFESLKKNSDPYWTSTNHLTTGSHMTAWAATLGYRNIILLGIDSKYVEQIPEARSSGGIQLEIVKTPEHNPNYFFDGYQQQGDKYNTPNANPAHPTHKLGWEELAPVFISHDVLVVNANPDSTLTSFYKMTFDKSLEFIYQQRISSILIGPFSNTKSASFDETKFIRKMLGQYSGTLIEVGAHHGSETILFLRDGWRVYAFEPDDTNRKKLLKKIAPFKKLITIDERAVSNVSNLELPFYVSPESSGISSLSPFLKSHYKSKKVSTVSLDDYLKEHSIDNIDFLKIDAEGYDGIILKSFPFSKIKPEFILCEFEDKKTVPLGYTMKDMADFLCEKGYTIYVSDWYPIVKYGVSHNWIRLYQYPGFPASPHSWGNLIAVLHPFDNNYIKEIAKNYVKIKETPINDATKISPEIKTKKKHKRKIHNISYYVMTLILICISNIIIYYLAEDTYLKWLLIIFITTFLTFSVCIILLYRSVKHIKRRIKKLEIR